MHSISQKLFESNDEHDERESGVKVLGIFQFWELTSTNQIWLERICVRGFWCVVCRTLSEIN